MIHLVTGPPCAGKSTFVEQEKAPGDIVVDLDAMANAMGDNDSRIYGRAFSRVVMDARQAAIDSILKQHRGFGSAWGISAWIIHGSPSEVDKARYTDAGCHVHALDPGEDVVMQRVRDLRPAFMVEVARRYYHPEQRPARRVY